MPIKNTKEFIKILESEGELKRISAEVDPVLEITEIADRMSKTYGPALFFEKVKGSPFPLLINALGSTMSPDVSKPSSNLSRLEVLAKRSKCSLILKPYQASHRKK